MITKLLLKTLLLLLIVYILTCVLLYFFQEKLIFYPDKLNKDFKFSFRQPFEEVYISAEDGKQLNGLLFKADESKGLIFYLHGNAGALNDWGAAARRYTDLHYDVFMLDYRGYGKSEGTINNATQFFDDVQLAYNAVKKQYQEENIVVLGYSLGSGPASWLASVNHPKLLILQAPYYSLTDMMRHTYPVIPTFLLKYKFETDRYIKDCKMPVVIFHGDKDEVIYYNSSVKLKALMKNTDTFITLKGQGHSGITDNPEYVRILSKILN